jgi:hypothetical protein
LRAFRRIRGRESLNDQDHFVYERRPKTVSQLLPDGFSLTAFDTGRGLEVTLGVKRERKKCKGCCEDDP